MASPVRWPWARSIDPVVRARSLAAAGTLTAAGWKPSDGNYTDALAAIIKHAGSGPISWQDPCSSDVICSTPFDDKGLADAWTAAFLAKAQSADPKPVARIAVDPHAQGAAPVEHGYIATYHELLSPWLNRMDDGQPGQIAAVSLAAFDQAKPHDWKYPLRVGLEGQSLSERIDAMRGVRGVKVVPHGMPAADVLLSDWNSLEAAQMEELAPGVAIIYSRGNIDGGMIDQVAGKISMPTAMIEMSPKAMPKYLNEFTVEIALNKPLDVALFDAYRTIHNPKAGHGDELSPLVLLAPKSNQGTAFEAVKVENRVRDLVDRLGNLPKDVVIGSPPPGSKRLGIGRDALTVDDYRGHLSKALTEDNLDFSREIFGSKVLRATTKAIEKVEADLGVESTSGGLESAAPASETAEMAAPPGETSPPEEPAPFSAFPRLDTPEEAKAGIEFEIEVGFSDVADPRAENQEKITISDARAGEDLLVLVSAENGVIAKPNRARLALKLEASAKFNVKPATDAPLVRITVEYLFRNNLVGQIAKTVAIAGRPKPEPDDPPIANLFRPILTAVDRNSLDLVLLIKREEGTRVTWQAIRGEKVSDQYPVDVGDARQFASQLDRDQRPLSYKGESHATVRVTGQTIADLIPPEITSDFLVPCLKDAKTPPRILILTNEPYIPWELALFDSDVTGQDQLQYFGAIARIGRWWVAPRMAAPLPGLAVGKISVICAENYVIKTGKRPLPQAIAERNWLKEKYKDAVVLIEGTLQPVMDWIKSLPIGAGHLAHFALHGYSNPNANEQVLVLGDGANLTPPVLSDVRRINAVPRYGMVFLNACQVATGALTLGQFAGFPGALLQAGTNAVIGPIWEVNDDDAHDLVMNFYENVMDKKIPVSEALRQIRATPGKNGTTTPLAYIFYGHPDLTLQR